jgi:5-carboxymethyl-2-hydroxymuconate isomerase
MPHLTLEYTDNLSTFKPANALLTLNRVLVASDEFQENDIKSRALPLHTFLVGTGSIDYAYIHVKLALLSGRSAEKKSALSNALLSALREASGDSEHRPLKLTVEIVDLDRASYAKDELQG